MTSPRLFNTHIVENEVQTWTCQYETPVQDFCVFVTLATLHEYTNQIFTIRSPNETLHWIVYEFSLQEENLRETDTGSF